MYFPGGGFCSVLTVLEDGRMVEVATIGREGAVGVLSALDGGPSPACGMVQAEMDTCYRMTAVAFRREMNRRGAFYELLTHYTQHSSDSSCRAPPATPCTPSSSGSRGGS